MKSLHLCVLPGDGIGPEVTAEAVKVMERVCKASGIELRLEYALLGGAAIDEEGIPLPMKTIERCRAADAVLLGAVGGPKWDAVEAHNRPEAGLLGIRAKLGLYANLRPAKVFPPLKNASPLREDIVSKGVDLLVVRELTGGIYFGEKGHTEVDGQDAAYDVELYSVPEIERISKTAFDMAMARSKKLTSIDKANVLESSRLWRSVINRIAQQYPEVEVGHMYVDNASMQLVRNPSQFDVIVTSNIFGDILSDESAMISGSIGMLPSASLGYSGGGLYEPIHGSAPDIAGQGIANPLATILSLGMMFRYTFRMPEQAAAIEQAVENVLAKYRTPDIAAEGLETVSTSRMGDLVAQEAEKLVAAK